MFTKPLIGIAPDYSRKENWLSLPERADKAVDLIYLYPSSCNDSKSDVICAIDDQSMIEGAKRNFAQQATAFEPVANLFAPYWRQVNGMKLPIMSFEEVDAAEWAEPRTDVYAALDYYFEHLNQGRPFFLAGHSQGSRLCYIVLSDYMKAHPERYANMNAAYSIGDSLTRQYLEVNPHVKAAKAADDLGVVVSWNTEGPGNKNEKNGVVLPRSIAINPLNWRRDDTYAPASENLGDRLPVMPEVGVIATEFHEHHPGLADAQLDLERGVVISTTMAEHYVKPPVPGMRNIFGPASLHVSDYPAFWDNIRQNVNDRIDAFLKNKR